MTGESPARPRGVSCHEQSRRSPDPAGADGLSGEPPQRAHRSCTPGERAPVASPGARECGLELDARLIFDLPESRDPISSFEAGQKITEDLIKQKRPFTALLAFDDMTACGAIRALGTMGLDVPKDCSVIGLDDSPAAAYY